MVAMRLKVYDSSTEPGALTLFESVLTSDTFDFRVHENCLNSLDLTCTERGRN